MSLPKANCWTIKECGREVGGRLAGECGACPAATIPTGVNGGANGGEQAGRLCWAVAGTFCGGEVHGQFAAKSASCTTCDVFRRVQEEEGPAFALHLPVHTAQGAMVEQFVSMMSIIEAINGVVYVADFDTHELLFVNAYAATLFGAGLVGKRCYAALQAGQTGPCSFCTNDRLVVDGRPGPPVVWEFQNTITKKWFMCIDKAIRWWDGRLVRMEVAIDITDRKAAERFREEYLALVSHDLRNPLNNLVLTVQVARRALQSKGLEAEARELDTVLATAWRMNTLVTDLVETSRLEAGHIELAKQRLELRDWAAHIVRRTVTPAGKGRIVMRADDEPVNVLADPARLDRVLENLLSNALKFSDEATVEVHRDGGEARVSVIDVGVGVPAAELPGLFQPFSRASTCGKVKGTGLGLYSARLIVETHGGRIWAESEVGRGSRFHFALPLAPAA
jgi:signal transduction histidine kinase